MPSAKSFNWNPDKNTLLIEARGISFERIVFEIGNGNELAVFEHPNQEKYPGQRISLVQVDDYVYAVPFVEIETEIFLKTIIQAVRRPVNTGVCDERQSQSQIKNNPKVR